MQDGGAGKSAVDRHGDERDRCYQASLPGKCKRICQQAFEDTLRHRSDLSLLATVTIQSGTSLVLRLQLIKF